MKKIISFLMALIISITTIPLDTIVSYANENEFITRGEFYFFLNKWFDLENEVNTTPDNYFSDLSESNKYYEDIITCIAAGLVEGETGGKIYPENPVDREFLSHVLNLKLKFKLKNNEYTFEDYELCSYPQDDQVAINNGFFELINNKFSPNVYVSYEEIYSIGLIVEDLINAENIDDNHQDQWNIKSDIKTIPKGTKLSVDKEHIFIYDTNISIIKGEKIAIAIDDYWITYIVKNVAYNDEYILVEKENLSQTDGFESIDAEGTIDGSNFSFIGNPYATVEKNIYPSTNYALSDIEVEVSNIVEYVIEIPFYVSTDGNIVFDSDDNTTELATLSVTLSNLTGKYKINTTKEEILVEISGDLVYEINAHGEIEISDTIPLGELYCPGIGGLSLNPFFNISGEMSLVSGATFTVGCFYSNKTQTLRDLSKAENKVPTLSISLVAEVGLKLDFGTDEEIPIISAHVYLSVGIGADFNYTTYFDDKLPKECTSVSIYPFLKIGISVAIDGGEFFSFSETFEYDIVDGVSGILIANGRNPIRLELHFEDDERVDECSRNDTEYVTPSKSSLAEYVDIIKTEISSNFEYYINNNTITLTGYSGDSKVVKIPATINGMDVTKILSSAFVGSNVETVIIPNTITSMYSGGNSGAFAGSNIKNVIFDDGITKIPAYALAGASTVENVSIPDSVTYIAENAFMNTGISELTLPPNIEKLGSNILKGNQNVETVIIPNTITSMYSGG
ncbi:MAG: leucine-rich repeat protein, partial [Eubacterium sp.]